MWFVTQMWFDPIIEITRMIEIKSFNRQHIEGMYYDTLTTTFARS